MGQGHTNSISCRTAEWLCSDAAEMVGCRGSSGSQYSASICLSSLAHRGCVRRDHRKRFASESIRAASLIRTDAVESAFTPVPGWRSRREPNPTQRHVAPMVRDRRGDRVPGRVSGRGRTCFGPFSVRASIGAGNRRDRPDPFDPKIPPRAGQVVVPKLLSRTPRVRGT